MNKPAKIIQPVVIILVVIGLVALALSGYLSPIIRTATSPVLVVQSWLASRFLAIQNILNVPEDLVILRQRNIELEEEVSRLQARDHRPQTRSLQNTHSRIPGGFCQRKQSRKPLPGSKRDW